MKEEEMHLAQRFRDLRFLGRGVLSHRREVVNLLVVPTEALTRLGGRLARRRVPPARLAPLYR
jgi:hypothetical protein